DKPKSSKSVFVVAASQTPYMKLSATAGRSGVSIMWLGEVSYNLRYGIPVRQHSQVRQ
ncbi:hypothetical protein ScPMuIL_005776, partial [Solemya velum]